MNRLMLAFASALTLLWLVVGNTGAQVAPDKKPAAVPVRAWPPNEVKGYGRTVEDARANAVERATGVVVAHIRNQEPPLNAWTPDAKYVQEHLLDGPGRQGEKVQLADNKADLGAAEVWIVTFKPNPDWAAMTRLDQTEQRKLRSTERETTTARFLLGAVLLLGGGWGYVRLDEITHRRFSRWLQIGGVALLASLLGVGLLLS